MNLLKSFYKRINNSYGYGSSLAQLFGNAFVFSLKESDLKTIFSEADKYLSKKGHSGFLNLVEDYASFCSSSGGLRQTCLLTKVQDMLHTEVYENDFSWREKAHSKGYDYMLIASALFDRLSINKRKIKYNDIPITEYNDPYAVSSISNDLHHMSIAYNRLSHLKFTDKANFLSIDQSLFRKELNDEMLFVSQEVKSLLDYKAMDRRDHYSYADQLFETGVTINKYLSKHNLYQINSSFSLDTIYSLLTNDQCQEIIQRQKAASFRMLTDTSYGNIFQSLNSSMENPKLKLLDDLSEMEEIIGNIYNK